MRIELRDRVDDEFSRDSGHGRLASRIDAHQERMVGRHERSGEVAPAGNIRRLLKIIAGVDRPDSDELEIIPLKHASASELVRILNSLSTSGKGKDVSNKVKMVADDRTNSVLVSGERSARLRIRATVSFLDTPLEDGGGNTHVIYLKYAKAENIVKILTGLKEKGVKARPTKGKGAASKITSGSTISQNAIIQGDDETNALIITADPNTVKNLKAVIRQLDIRRAQVLIEAIIAEIAANKNREVGVGLVVDGSQRDAGALPIGLSNFSGIGALLQAALAGSSTTTSVSAPGGLTLALGEERDSGVRYGAILRALQGDSNSKILSTPSVVTLDNEEAELIVGENVPFVTGSFTGAGSTDPTNPFQTIERQDVGLTLKVTPQINEGDTVKLVIEQEISSVQPDTEGAGLRTRKRSIKTSVLVDDGGILILGGLMQEEETESQSKIPLLGDIPLLGFLFRSSSTSKTNQNLMVFLRPSILRDRKDADTLTNEKYSFIRGLQSESFDINNAFHSPLKEIEASLQPIEKTELSTPIYETLQKKDIGDDNWDEEYAGFN